MSVTDIKDALLHIEPKKKSRKLTNELSLNMVDLSRLTKIDKDGYIRYKRAKTGRAYCIKVEPEAVGLFNIPSHYLFGV